GRRSSVPPPKREVPREPIIEVTAQLVDLPVMPAVAELPVASSAGVVPEEGLTEVVEPALTLDPVDPARESALEKTLALTLDIVGMAGRYPSLRNAFQPSEKN